MRGAVAVAVGLCLLTAACGTDEKEMRVVALGTAPRDAARITVPAAGPEGITPPGSWPRACDLLTAYDVRAVLPDATELSQEARRLEFTVRSPTGISGGTRRIPGGHCTYIYYLAGTEDEEYRESYKGWLNVTVEIAGDPDVVETNFGLLAHGTPTEPLGATACVAQQPSAYLCRTRKLAFTVHSVNVPDGFRFEGQPEGDEGMMPYFNEHALPALVEAVTAKLRRSRSEPPGP